MSAFDADARKLKLISSQPYKVQAVDFLNAFWANAPVMFKDHPQKREEVWDLLHMVVKLDKKGEAGSELDEFQAHRVLEATKGALTVQELRRVMTTMDLTDDKLVSLSEFLIFFFGVDWHEYVNAPKCDDEKVAAAEKKVRVAQAALQRAIDSEENAQLQLQASVDSEKKAKEEEAAAVVRADAAKAAEEEVVSAREAQEPALASVNAQEKAFKDAIADLEAKSNDESLSTVKKNKAKAELAQLKQEDPLPLRKAKIGLEAAIRRLTRAVKSAAAQTAASMAARDAASAAREEAVQAKKASQAAAIGATEARLEAEAAMTDAQEFLEVTKTQFSGSAGGAIWMMGRELEEAKKYMPKAKIRALEATQALAAV